MEIGDHSQSMTGDYQVPLSHSVAACFAVIPRFVLADRFKCLWKRRQPVSVGWRPRFTRTDSHSQPQSTADW